MINTNFFKKSLLLLICGLFLCLGSSAFAAKTSAKVQRFRLKETVYRDSYKLRYYSFGHEILDNQARYGFDVDAVDYRILDDLIEESIKRIPIKKSYTKAEIIKILKTVEAILIKQGFDFSKKQNIDYVFSDGLKNSRKGIRCYDYGILGLSVYTVLKIFRVHPVSAPRHVFLRVYINDREYINWERPNGGVTVAVGRQEIKDSEYLQALNFSKAQVDSGTFLRNLRLDEFRALDYVSMAYMLLKEEKFQESKQCIREAEILYPQLLGILDIKAHYSEKKGDKNKAIEYWTKYLDIYPNSFAVRVNRGNRFHDLAKYDEALEDLQISIKLNPDDPRGFFYLGRALFKKGERVPALINFVRAAQIDSDFASMATQEMFAPESCKDLF